MGAGEVGEAAEALGYFIYHSFRNISPSPSPPPLLPRGDARARPGPRRRWTSRGPEDSEAGSGPRAAGGAPRPAAPSATASRGSQLLPVRPGPAGRTPAEAARSPAPRTPPPRPAAPGLRSPAVPRESGGAAPRRRRGLGGPAAAARGRRRAPASLLPLPAPHNAAGTARPSGAGPGPGASFPQPFPAGGAGHLHGWRPGRR